MIAQPGRVAWDVFDEVRERPILGFTDYGKSSRSAA